MKKILGSGILAALSLGLIFFLGKFLIADILGAVARPWIISWFHREYLVYPLTIALTLALIIVLGIFVSKIKILERITRLLGDGKDSKGGRVALITHGDVDFFGLVTKEVKYIRLDGKTEDRCVVYLPTSPTAWTGAPIAFIPKNEVRLTAISMSPQEFYSTVSSFGLSCPEEIREIEKIFLLKTAK